MRDPTNGRGQDSQLTDGRGQQSHDGRGRIDRFVDSGGGQSGQRSDDGFGQSRGRRRPSLSLSDDVSAKRATRPRRRHLVHSYV